MQPVSHDIVLDDTHSAVYRDGRLWRAGTYDEIARWAADSDPDDGTFQRHVLAEGAGVNGSWPDRFDDLEHLLTA